MSEAILIALITSGGAAVVAAFTAWAAVRKSKTEMEKKLDLMLYRQDETDKKISNIGNMLDRLARLETRVDGLEGKQNAK
jgi:hypothetical protein